MLDRIRNSIFTKLLWGLMGAHLLNICVDTQDPYPESIPEDLTINDQESIIEIVLEQLLGFEDAIKEYDDHDTEDHNKKKVSKIDLISPLKHNPHSIIPIVFIKEKKYSYYNAHLRDGYHQLDIPPPKV